MPPTLNGRAASAAATVRASKTPTQMKAPHEHGRAAMLLARAALDGSTPRRTAAGQSAGA